MPSTESRSNSAVTSGSAIRRSVKPGPTKCCLADAARTWKRQLGSAAAELSIFRSGHLQKPADLTIGETAAQRHRHQKTGVAAARRQQALGHTHRAPEDRALSHLRRYSKYRGPTRTQDAVRATSGPGRACNGARDGSRSSWVTRREQAASIPPDGAAFACGRGRSYPALHVKSRSACFTSPIQRKRAGTIAVPHIATIT